MRGASARRFEVLHPGRVRPRDRNRRTSGMRPERRSCTRVVHAGIPGGDATGAAFLVRARHEHAHREGAAQLFGLCGVILVGGLWWRSASVHGGSCATRSGQQRARAALAVSSRRPRARPARASHWRDHHRAATTRMSGFGSHQRAEHEGAIERVIQHAQRAAHRAAHGQRAGETIGVAFGQATRDQSAHRGAPGDGARGRADLRHEGIEHFDLVARRFLQRPSTPE